MSFIQRTAIAAGLVFSMLAGFPATGSAADPKFRFPLPLSPSATAYYDHDSGPGAKSFLCSSLSYNGHAGNDFRAPVGTPVYAAAAGGLYYRYNGCSTYGSYGATCGGGFGNHVRIDHEGSQTDGAGWVTIYAHLQRDTASYAQSLLCGARIGKTGSSGNSTGPHLHFEVRKYGTPYSDPFAGPCGTHPESWWISQNGQFPTAQCS